MAKTTAKKRNERHRSIRGASREFLAPIYAGINLPSKASLKLKRSSFSVISSVVAVARRRKASCIGTAFPKDFEELGSQLPTASTENLEAELRWTGISILSEAEALREFEPLRATIGHSILTGKYDETLSGVETAINKFGQTWWACSIRFLVEQKRNGLEAQRTILQDICKHELIPWVKVLAHGFSQRAEDGMSAEEFDAYCANLRSTPEDSLTRKKSRAYFQFAFNYHHFEESEFLSDCLNIEESHSLIDRFLTFARVFRSHVIASDFDISPDLIWLLKQIQTRLPDERLNILAMALCPEDAVPTPLAQKVMSILHQYTIGQYRQALDESEAALTAHVGLFEFYELYAKASLRMGATWKNPFDENTVAGSILEATRHIIARDYQKKDSLRLLHKFAHQLDPLPIAEQLFSFYRQYTNDSKALRADSSLISGAGSPTPRLATNIGNAERCQIYLNALDRHFPNNESIALFKATQSSRAAKRALTPNPSLPASRILKFEAYVLESNADYIDALAAYEQLYKLAASNPLLRSDAITGLYRCHLQLKNLFECAMLLTDSAVDNPDLVSSSTVIELLANYDASESKATLNSIAWPVLKYIADRDKLAQHTPDELHDALDDFLTSVGVQRPSEMRAIPIGSPTHVLVFLLRYVCVEGILDSSIWYDTQEEIEQERIRVCEWLTALDPDNIAAYTAEIAGLLGRATTRELTHQVGHNKIFVDTEGIKSTLPTSFSDRVVRCFQYALLAEGLRDGISVVGVIAGDEKNVNTVQADEGLKIFRSLFNELRGEFVSSAEYGLDANLSQRIRHGTLLGEIRAQFEVSRLLTERQENDEYSVNRFWVDKLCPDGNGVADVAKAFADLSKSVDSLADEVRGQWIQIRNGPENVGGMFDLEFSDDELRVLMARLKEIRTVDDFVDLVFAALWQKTEASLDRIRIAISTTLRDKLFSLLDACATRLEEVVSVPALADVRGTIANCQIQVENSLQGLAEWFRVDRDQGTPPFYLSSLLSALCGQVKQFCGPSQLIVAISNPDDRLLDGRLFRPFWDLLFILLDNVAKHSKAEMAEVNLNIVQHDAGMKISITNTLGPTANRDSLKETGINLTVAGRRGLQSELLRTEGGSGFPKLGKILRYDVQCDSQDIVATVDADDRFSVTIELTQTGLYHEDSASR